MQFPYRLTAFDVLCADNTTLSSGSGGDTIATDDISGVKYPRSKIVIGADGTNDGDVSSANPLPVKGTGTAGTANSGVVTVQGIASMTAIQVADNSGSLTVDAPVATPVFVRLSDGSSAIATLPVSVASVPSHDVTNAGTFAVQVSSVAAGDNNIGNVDIVTVPAPLSTTGGGTEATALRVTVASDSTGVLSVDDNGGALTVDNAGTFATQATLTPATSGGLDTFKSTDIDETEEDVKTSAGLLYWIYCVNTNASARYLKVYNATAANVTVGSTATKLDLLVPPSNSGFFIQFPHGITFGTAISVAATTGVGDSDAGAPGANEVQVTVGYK